MSILNFSRYGLPQPLCTLFLTTFIFALSLGSAAGALNTADRGESYIIQGIDGSEVAAVVSRFGGHITAELPIINGVAANLDPLAHAALLNQPSITQMMPNASVSAAGHIPTEEEAQGKPTADYTEVIGANQVWATGNTGQNITVAIVDTGIKPSLPGLQKTTNKAPRTLIWQDLVAASAKPDDLNGHGSHIAGIIASSLTGADGQWNGVAPNVSLVSVRVLDETGAGSYASVIEGIQWVVDNKDTYNIRVLNLSLVATPQSPYWADPINQATMKAWEAGIVVIAAAGNSGPSPMSITVPGNNPYVITVGAFTDDYTPADWSDDYITPFSAAGPTLDGFVKPDLIAPGAHIVSTMQSSTAIAKAHDAHKIGGTHFSMAGTSQATAVVSGVVALMLNQNSTLTPDEVKFRLMHSALLWTDDTGRPHYSVWQQGAGRLNAYDAVTAAMDGQANIGLDIAADLANPDGGYEGYSYFDENTHTFRLHGEPANWDGYTAWDGGFTAWAGGFTAWAGNYGAWAGGFTAWAGGFTAWAGGFTAWAGSEPWAGRYDDGAFIGSFRRGENPGITTRSQVDDWVQEMDEAVFMPFITR